MLGLNGSIKKSYSNVDNNKTTGNTNKNSSKKSSPLDGLLQSAELAVSTSAPSQSANTSQVIGIKEIKSKQRVSQ